MAKALNDRMTDTLAYMAEKLTPTDYREITNLLAARPHVDLATANNDLSQEMSIGNKNPFRKAARRAKRSLILLALLFIENPGDRTTEVARIKNLPENAKAGLIEQMRSWFTIPGVTGERIANLARENIARMPKWHNVSYFGEDAIRGVYDVSKPFNCYNACLFWAFQAGAISKRFLFNKQGNRNGNDFFPIFSRCGWDTLVESQLIRGDPPDDRSLWRSDTITDVSNGGEFNNIPAGLTVYFDQEPNKVFGHVACSLGDGTVISQNSVIPALWANIGGKANMVNHPLRRPQWEADVNKMTHAITHILPIRYLLDLHFFPQNAYKRLKVTRGHFWEVFPLAER